ncbi:MAG: helix-turn-helix domain-containing protein [Firmicutes bacterium]|nr:helix-turn-helix domain-containing protein [Bacillota bacterium]
MNLGEKIRHLRKERGLSQEEVGRGVLTRSMISAIERGKARPSLKTLEVIAQGLGKSVDYFLEDEVTDQTYKRVRAHLTLADALMWAGEPERAKELLTSVLPAAEHLSYRAMEVRIALGRAELATGQAAAARREFESCLAPDDGVMEEELAEARYHLGETYLATGQPVDALAQLEAALPGLREVSMQMACLMALARCHTALNDPAAAVSRLEAAYDLASGVSVRAQAAARLREAERALSKGAYEGATREADLAVRLYRTASFGADAERVPVALGRALAYAGAERRALRILRLSYREAMARDDLPRAAEVLTEMATIHRSVGQLGVARAQARRALALAGDHNRQATAFALYLLGAIAREERDMAEAERRLSAAAEVLERADAPAALQVDVFGLLAEVLRAVGRDREAYDYLARAHAIMAQLQKARPAAGRADIL